MVVSIGRVWDSTTDVLAGRASLLAPVAALAFFLPAALQAAVSNYGGASIPAATLGALIAALGLVATLWGQLTVLGVASDPDMTREAAGGLAWRRLGAALLVVVVLLAVIVLAMLPVGIALAVSGFDVSALATRAGSASPPTMAPGAALFIVLYGLALIVGLLWFSARILLWSAVVLHERRGLGAIGRSIALTRGLALKLIGVGLLAVIVYGVAAMAAQFIVFIPLRLLLGPSLLATATFLGALVAAAIGAAFSTVVAVFTARLYAALTALG